MRLLHTRTLELSEFDNEASRPYYAILSHTWGDDEFIFSDFAKPDRRSSSGWRKIAKSCELAAADGWEFAWVDTCCIDKSSSAELTEAINSMWKWYKDSQICYVYLADCSLSNGISDLSASRWFTRGWTLQELLAPERLIFYDADWHEIGSRSYLQQDISAICRIAPSHLTDPTAASVAAKMSWASQRETTREEDLAYSLLGLFEINMPLIYGEGNKAFFRLQSEIIRSSKDQSIFAWTLDSQARPYTAALQETGMLAPRLSCFVESGDIVPKHFQPFPQTPYQMTNHGLQIEFCCVEVSSEAPAAFLSQNFEELDLMREWKLFQHLIHELRMQSPGGSQAPNRSRYSKLWTIMLPCVRSTHKITPISLLISRSHEGQYARVDFPLLAFKKEVSLENLITQFKSMPFLISNEGHSEEINKHCYSRDVPGHPFIDVAPKLQHWIHDAQKPLTGRPTGLQWIFKVELVGKLHLMIMFNSRASRASKWDFFLPSVKENLHLLSHLQLSDIEVSDEETRSIESTHPLSHLGHYPGGHIVTLGDTDDYALPYDEEHQILFRARRTFHEEKHDPTVYPSRGSKKIRCCIRLEERELPFRRPALSRSSSLESADSMTSRSARRGW